MLKTFIKAMAFAIWNTLRCLCVVVACILLLGVVVFVPVLLVRALKLSSTRLIALALFGAYAFEIWLFPTVCHAWRATKYVLKKNCSIKEAWEAVTYYGDEP